VSKPRVLLVDDDEDVRHMTRVSLGFEGFDVAEAVDGTAGLEAARASQPDAIVLDVMMPGRDGLSVLRELRQDDALKEVPVVILTAKANAEQEGWNAGATAYLTKPFTVPSLAATLRRLLDEAAPESVRSNALARIDLAARLNAAADTIRSRP
jgi:DNA-binding response OmpR family regulator